MMTIREFIIEKWAETWEIFKWNYLTSKSQKKQYYADREKYYKENPGQRIETEGDGKLTWEKTDET